MKTPQPRCAAMLGLLAFWSIAAVGVAGGPVTIQVDFSRAAGVVRPLHGINKGPIAAGGTLNLVESQKALAVPWIRLHDCQWPYPDVVDMHAIYREPSADPALASSYDFALTDDYMKAVRQTGAGVIYRLGESIEHGAVKRYVHPPADEQRWADACLGVIRHYNEGWADGYQLGIQYWEIWNEPENRPAMWTGTDQQFLQLYRVAAKTIKKRFPSLKAGGPAFGYYGDFVDGVFKPSAFVNSFLTMCRDEGVPLDFFSWHCYTDNPGELVARAKAIRKLLDNFGLRQTESHLNEWNYLPGNSWAGFAPDAPAARKRDFYAMMAGQPGASFACAALIALQDAPVDVCNFYHGETGGFGLHEEHGVPNVQYEAFQAFAQLAKLQTRHPVTITGSTNVFALAASTENKRAEVLVSNFQASSAQVVLSIQGLKSGASYTMSTAGEKQTLTGVLSGTESSIELLAKAHGVIRVQIAWTK